METSFHPVCCFLINNFIVMVPDLPVDNPTDFKNKTIHKGNWISFKEASFIAKEKKRTWEYVERKDHSNRSVDAVEIIALIKEEGHEDKIVLISQFRPPINKLCLEFPAGLVDHDEDINTAALRELKEETGFIGKVISVSPTLVYEPGLSNSNLRIVRVDVRKVLVLILD